MKGDICRPLADLSAERGKAGGVRSWGRMGGHSKWEEGNFKGKER